MELKWDFHEFEDFADRLNDFARFESYCKVATEEITKVMLNMLKTNTPVVTGKLRGGWDSTFTVAKLKQGFKVVLKNKVRYAAAVNNGHYSHNQYNVGGQPYVVKHRTVPFDPMFGGDYPSDATYVYGRFFVENSILKLNNSKQIEQILYKQLQKWWKGCF